MAKVETMEQIASNGKTVVSRAFVQGRFVALKEVRAAFDQSSNRAQSATREVVLLYCLSHPTIVVLREVAFQEDSLLLTFDYMSADLRHVIIGDRLAGHGRSRVAHQLFAALEFLHSARIAHRTIEPAHILMDESSCRARLCGFSSARYCGEYTDENHQLTKEDDAKRPYCYRAFEDLAGDSWSAPKGDIWAAGCILIEMETRSPAFPRFSKAAVLESHIKCRDHRDNKTDSSPIIRARIHAARASTDTTRKHDDDVDDCASLLKEKERQDDVSDLALSCVTLDPTCRPSASATLLHPLFSSLPIQTQRHIGPLYDHIEDHLGDALLEERRRLKPHDYKKHLFDYISRAKVSRS